MTKITHFTLKNHHIGNAVRVGREAIPTGLTAAESYTDFWQAEVAGRKFILGKGYTGGVEFKHQRQQYVVWYPNGKFWSGYGMTIAEAIEGAIENAWFYI